MQQKQIYVSLIYESLSAQGEIGRCLWKFFRSIWAFLRQCITDIVRSCYAKHLLQCRVSILQTFWIGLQVVTAQDVSSRHSFDTRYTAIVHLCSPLLWTQNFKKIICYRSWAHLNLDHSIWAKVQAQSCLLYKDTGLLLINSRKLWDRPIYTVNL